MGKPTIQNGHARAVLQGPRSYEEMRATITLLKLMVQGEDDLRAGRVIEQGITTPVLP